MSYLAQAQEPQRRLDVEMDLVARNLVHIASRYSTLPMGRRTLVIMQEIDVVLGSGRWSTIAHRPETGGCPITRSRLRLPGLTSATTRHAQTIEASDPWAWQSGISLASDAMVTWIVTAAMSGKTVFYDPDKRTLYADTKQIHLDFFKAPGLGAHCYPTEAYFAQDVCTYLSQWWTVEAEVDGDLRGDEVRIDAILTHREQRELVIGIEFKNPHGNNSALRGLTQAARYRHAYWQGHGKIPVAYCCPGTVPTGREAQHVQETLMVGILDFDGSWSLTTKDFSWSEHVGLLTRADA